jgi:galactokinase
VSALRVTAPGRVNLIGGHTDYAGGLVLPMAIDLATIIEGERGGTAVELRSADEPDPAVVPLGVDDPSALEPAWARYVGGVVAELRPAAGFQGTVQTTIPIGTGLSSSAALEVAVALALGAQGTPQEVAQLCQRAEHRASGVPCGIMDQLTCTAAVAGHAVLIDCTTLAVEAVPLPEDAAWVVVDTGAPRALAESGYAARRADVAAAEVLVGPLPQATLADVAGIADPVVRARARHVVSENQRVSDFCAALAADDLPAAGEIMTASHRSMRDDHDVTTPALDALVVRLCAMPGVHGARLTGGGWGGCVLALTDPGALTEGITVRPSAGAHVAPADRSVGDL